MAEVAKMFGLELEEHFHITRKSYENTVYKFTKDGVAFYDNKLRTWYESVGALAGILTGETEVVKLPWKPGEGEKYYVPRIAIRPEDRQYYYYWKNDSADIKRYEMGIICKTPEEAIAMTEKMLRAIKE